ncbi:hypothetical protein SCALM49S_01890 [Streptomyces californicus]
MNHPAASSRNAPPGSIVRRSPSSRAASRSAPSVRAHSARSLVEALGRADQQVDAVRGEADQGAPAVGGVRGTLDVAEPFQLLDRLPRRLLGDAEPSPDLPDGRAVTPHGLEGEAVRGAGLGVPVLGQIPVQGVDDRTEPREEQQGQLEAVAHIDNLVYLFFVNHVVDSNRPEQGGPVMPFPDLTPETAPPGSRRAMEAVTERLGYRPAAIARLAASPHALDGFLNTSAIFESARWTRSPARS